MKTKKFDENIYKVINGDSMKVLDTLEENSIDSVITDPPYGLTTITKRFGKENSAPAQFGKDGSFARLSKGFMGKEWDGSGIEYNVEFWSKVWRVLKPGGYLLAFGGSRTFHRIACAIEDAGFEIRDTIMWLYGSGFPKSMNIGLAIDKKNGVESEIVETKTIKKLPTTGIIAHEKEGWRKGGYDIDYQVKQATNEWNGWGTCLKPAFEPIIVARKPVEDSVINNVMKYGVGGINIDGCRVNNTSADTYDLEKRQVSKATGSNDDGHFLDQLHNQDTKHGITDLGRFPSNVILTYDDTDFNEVCGGMPNTKSNGGNSSMPDLDFVGKEQVKNGNGHKLSFGQVENAPRKQTDYFAPKDEGSAARYFYCAKASKKDRDSGLDMLESKLFHRMRPDADPNKLTGLNTDKKFAPALRKNIHPTVKPVELMQYLIRLVSPKGATILDPFNGSGSTGKAVAFENRERDELQVCRH